jgi:4-amino-4-deoxy-L-arabinose transferase-like glycosyltransferase
MPASFRQVESSDYVATYRPTAMNLLNGNGYTLNSGQFVTFFPPGYSIILAAWFRLTQGILHESTATVILNLITGGITSVLIYYLASKVLGIVAGLIAAFFWMTYPFYLWLLGIPNTELPFLVFFLSSVACFWAAIKTPRTGYRMVWMFSAGLTQGIALLIRPILIGMWILWSSFWLVWNIKTKKNYFAKTIMELGVFIIGIMILVIPWEVTVFRQTGDIIPISTAGLVGIRDGLTFGTQLKGYRQELHLSPDITSFMDEINALPGEKRFPLEVMRLTSKNIGRSTKLLLLKALRSWYATDSARYETVILPIQIVYLLLILWGFIAAWKSKSTSRLYAVYIALTTLYFWLATTSALSILRYMIPAMCLLMTLIPAGIFRLPLLKKAVKY